MVRTQILRFQEFESSRRFDGIWACASLLHIPSYELHDVLRRLIGALKPGGMLYLSVKYGSKERLSGDGRFFVDLNEETLQRLFTPFADARLIKVWITEGEGSLRGKDRWLNGLATKLASKNANDC
jgi:hypothetical protein